MARRAVAAALAAALLVVAGGVAAMYRNPIYLLWFGMPALVLLVAIGLLSLRGGPKGQPPQS